MEKPAEIRTFFKLTSMSHIRKFMVLLATQKARPSSTFGVPGPSVASWTSLQGCSTWVEAGCEAVEAGREVSSGLEESILAFFADPRLTWVIAETTKQIYDAKLIFSNSPAWWLIKHSLICNEANKILPRAIPGAFSQWHASLLQSAAQYRQVIRWKRLPWQRSHYTPPEHEAPSRFPKNSISQYLSALSVVVSNSLCLLGTWLYTISLLSKRQK